MILLWAFWFFLGFLDGFAPCLLGRVGWWVGECGVVEVMMYQIFDKKIYKRALFNEIFHFRCELCGVKMCFTCTLCAKVYSRRDSLKRHCKRAHSGGVDTSLGKLSDVVSTHSIINDANYAFEREKINSKIGGLKTESVREK